MHALELDVLVTSEAGTGIVMLWRLTGDGQFLGVGPCLLIEFDTSNRTGITNHFSIKAWNPLIGQLHSLPDPRTALVILMALVDREVRSAMVPISCTGPDPCAQLKSWQVAPRPALSPRLPINQHVE